GSATSDAQGICQSVCLRWPSAHAVDRFRTFDNRSASYMKILVTGGAGFIGSALVRHLIGRMDHEVVVIDKLTYAGNLTSLASVQGPPRYRFSRTDICNRRAVADIFSDFDPDAVMHLAAESHVDRSIDGPAEFINTNVVGTYVLLEASLAHWRTLGTRARD